MYIFLDRFCSNRHKKHSNSLAIASIFMEELGEIYKKDMRKNMCPTTCGLMMKSAWETVKNLAEKEENLGALPGMTSVLHTFGSDLKYHNHVHCLITFGGMKDDEWKWPKRKKQLASYRDYCREYRRIFLKGLEKLYRDGLIDYHESFAYFKELLGAKRWVVHSEFPTSNAKVISEYLSRYICRIGISQHRLHFDNVNKKITISFNDYKNQKPGEIAPKSTKLLSPLIAMYQILQHVLPK